MEEKLTEQAQIVQNLNSEDASVRRETAEMLLMQELPNDLVKLLVAKLNDPDKGVRDAVCVTLTYNPNKSIAQFVTPYVAHDDIAVRNLAGDILLKRGNSSIESMVAYIKQGDDDAKKFVIDILGLIGEISPKDEILDVLKQTENENVALACIEALGNIKAVDLIPDLIEEFDKSELYRPTIAESLGKMETEEALEFLMNRFSEVDELTQFSMFESLGRVGNEETFFFLLARLKESNPPITWALVASIKALKEKYELDIPYDEGTKNAVVGTILTADLTYRKAAASLLALFRDDEVYDTCILIYGDDPEIDSNIQSIFFENTSAYYSRICDFINPKQRNIKSLLEFTRSLLDFDQGEGLLMLGELTIHNLSEKLSDCLTHPNEDVRRYAMELLFLIKPDTAFVFVDTMSVDKDMWNRLRLIELLEGFSNPEVDAVLLQLTNDKEEMVVQRAQWLLDQRKN